MVKKVSTTTFSIECCTQVDCSVSDIYVRAPSNIAFFSEIVKTIHNRLEGHIPYLYLQTYCRAKSEMLFSLHLAR